MKNIFEAIKKGFILLIGTGIFTYGFFRFISIVLGEIARGLAGTYTISYNDNIKKSLIYLVVGVVFIVFWLVKTKKEKGLI